MMQLRRATSQDVPLLKYWDTKPHVIFATGADEPADWLEEIQGEPEVYEVFIAVEGDRPIGVVQIMDPLLEPSHYWGDIAADLRAVDIWIGEQSDLGQGLGALMMQLALERCFAPAQVTAVIIDPLAANIRAQKFFSRIGFEVVGPRTFGDDDCLVHQLTREQWRSRLPTEP